MFFRKYSVIFCASVTLSCLRFSWLMTYYRLTGNELALFHFLWALSDFLGLMNRPVGTTFSPCSIYKRSYGSFPVHVSLCVSTFQHGRVLVQLTDTLTYRVSYREDLCWPLTAPAVISLNWGRAYNKMDRVGLFYQNLFLRRGIVMK